MQPKAVVFDLGNVLVDVDHVKGVRELTGRGVPAHVFDHAGVTQALLQRYERGLVDRSGFYRSVCGEGSPVAFGQFCEIYCDIFSPIEPMIEANYALRRAGRATYVFSNTSELHFEHLCARFAFMSAFDRCFLSFEMGCMKPERASYEAVERGTGCAGRALLYIDDRIENVEAAQARGWTVIHHSDPARTLARLREMGFL
ncbi:MAG TPA: HAD family phosphatase [Burkholderiales bacterium]|nr:HAD family phosphatase [Burkholderiales bacterium]